MSVAAAWGIPTKVVEVRAGAQILRYRGFPAGLRMLERVGSEAKAGASAE